MLYLCIRIYSALKIGLAAGKTAQGINQRNGAIRRGWGVKPDRHAPF